MSDGFLDEIEKAIDDFSADKKKEINNDIKSPRKDIWGEYYRRRERRSQQELQSKYIKERLNKVPGVIQHLDCKCGVHMVVTTEGNPIPDWAEHHITNKYLEHDSFFCPKCATMWRVNGKVKEVKTIGMG